MKLLRKVLIALFFFLTIACCHPLSKKLQVIAANCDITGGWSADIHLTSPQVMDEQLLINVIHEPDGTFHGTVTDINGVYMSDIQGYVDGNQLYSDSTHVVLDGYEANIELSGTIDDSCNIITGSISGWLTKPLFFPLAGTFTALRTSWPSSPSPGPVLPDCLGNPSPIDINDMCVWMNHYLKTGNFDINLDGLINIWEAGYTILHWHNNCNL